MSKTSNKHFHTGGTLIKRSRLSRSASFEQLENRTLFSGSPSLDTTFNGTGEYLANWASGEYAGVTGVAELPSGQIMAVGQGAPNSSGTQEIFLARFNADGTPDNTFNPAAGTNYQFYNPFNDGNDIFTNNILLLSNGDFIISGTDNGQGCLFEFNSAGALNTGFGSNGVFTDSNQGITGVAPQGNDLLIGGKSGTNFAVSRVTATGQLDTTFGKGGQVLFTASDVSTEDPATGSPSGYITVRDDGSFVYSGVVGDDGSRSGLVANFNAQGTLSPAFGSSTGELLLNYGGDDSARCSLEPNGQLFVTDDQFNGDTLTYYIGTVSVSGTISTLTELGAEVGPSQYSDYWSDSPDVILSDGSLVQTGYTDGGDSTAGYLSSGDQSDIYKTDPGEDALDSNFGSSGDFSLADGSGDGLFAESAVLTSQGQLLIGGFADEGGGSDSIMLARYDLSTGTGSIMGSVEQNNQPIANVPVYADLPNSGKYQDGDPITQTNVFGNYALTGLEPGTYTVRVDLSNLPGVAPQVASYSATVGTGQTVSAQNFVLQPTVPSTTTLTAAARTLVVGQTQTVTVTVASASQTGPTPTGTVTVDVDGNNQTVDLNANGQASVPVDAAIAENGVSLSAVYNGDSNYSTSTSNSISQNFLTASSIVGKIGKATAPASTILGQKFASHLPITLTNTGQTLKGVFSEVLYLDTAPVGLSASPIQLETLPKNTTLKTRKSLAVSFSASAIPTSVAAGTYYLVAKIVDPLGDTDLITLPKPIVVETPVISPVASVGTFSPTTVVSGNSDTVTVTVANKGNVTATGSMVITLSPSSDGITAVPGVTLDTVTTHLAIKPGQSIKQKLRFKIPSSLAAGVYYPLVSVVIDGVSTTAVGAGMLMVG
jgi:uncharacterized delta-60 repeat protein